jgi:hypothetical protein
MSSRPERALLHSFSGEWRKSATTVVLERTPFAEGSMRLAFAGRVPLDAPPAAATDIVAKFAKNPDTNRSLYFKGMPLSYECN